MPQSLKVSDHSSLVRMKKAIPQLLLSWILVVVLGDPLDAQVRNALEKFRVVYSAIGSSQSPLWIGHEAGLFQKHGLDVELLYVAGGSRAAQVILSGEVPVAMFNGGSVISADLAGADLVNVASGMNVLPFFLVVGPGVKQIEELKGKKIAVTRLASATDYALRFAAEKWSVKPDRDFAVLQLSGQPETLTALKSGAVQGPMLNVEFTILARREGYRDLADVASMGLTFPGSGLNASRSFILTGGIRCCGLCVLTRTVFTTDELRRDSLLACWQSISRTQIPLSSNRFTIYTSVNTSRRFPILL